MQVKIVESSYPLTVVALPCPSAAFLVGDAVQCAERARLNHHFREVARLLLLLLLLSACMFGRWAGAGEGG